MYLVTKVLLNLDRFYSILAMIRCFDSRKSAIMEQFVAFRNRAHKLNSEFNRMTMVCD